MASYLISATTTYVWWHEDRLWNVTVLCRVHLLSLVTHHGGREADDRIAGGSEVRWLPAAAKR